MLVPITLTLLLAQSQDLTLSLGTARASDADNSHFLAANYAIRLAGGDNFSLSGQFDFAAVPNQKIRRVEPRGSRDFASLYAMPGLRVSFKRGSRLSPFVGGGVGLAVFKQSALLQNGDPFPGSRSSNHFGGFYGGGVDLKLYRFFGLRFEVKDYVSQRHNVAAGVGLHFRWGGN